MVSGACESKRVPSDKLFEYTSVSANRLIISLSITITVLFVELFGGLLINSVALISDAGHMFTHAFAIAIGLFAFLISRRPPCAHKTYGLYRAEVLGAMINGLFLIPIAGFMIFEAFERILNPLEINGYSMFLIAIIGLFTNLISILLLHKGFKQNLNIKGVFYHMFGDAASSIGIVIGAIFILYWNWKILDPLISICISLIILYWAVGILKTSFRVLLEISPKGLDTQMIHEKVMEAFPEVLEIYHIHLWTITPNILVFSSYIKINDNISDLNGGITIISRISDFLKEQFNITESTIQIAPKDARESCNI